MGDKVAVSNFSDSDLGGGKIEIGGGEDFPYLVVERIQDHSCCGVKESDRGAAVIVGLHRRVAECIECAIPGICNLHFACRECVGLTIEIIVFTGQLDGPFGVIEYNSAFIAKECHVIALDGTAIEVNFGSLYLIRLFLGVIVVSASCQCDAKHDDQAIYLILGLEIESKIHYAMAVRAMLYDALSYTEQVELIAAQRRKDKPKQTYHEFLSGLGKDDRLKPVITIVLNLSGKYWDGCQSIHDLLAVKDKQILQFVPDYKLNLLSPDLLDEQDFDKFRTSLGAAMQFLKHQHDDNMDWIQNNQRMQAIDRNTADFIQTTTGTDLHLKDDDEVINMCRAWEEQKELGIGQGIDSVILRMKEKENTNGTDCRLSWKWYRACQERHKRR